MAALSTADAIDQFGRAFDEIEASNPITESQETALAEFYFDEFAPNLAGVRGEQVDPGDFVPGESPGALYLQAVYIAESPLEPNERRFLTDPRDGSAWTGVHASFHPDLRAKADSLGFIDVYFVDARNDVIVYSTNKDVAFGTSVANGPHSGTALAGLARSILASDEPTRIQAADFTAFTPLLDRPSGFLGGQIRSGDELVGAVIVSIDIDEVSEITTEAFRAGRAGETGESYLVGPDRRMRTESRFFIESPSGYLAQIDELDTLSDLDRSRMEALGTTVVFQPVDNESVRQGLLGERDVVQVTNYLGQSVYSGHSPIAPDTFGWVLLVEQTIEEAEDPFTVFVRNVLTVTVVFIVVLTFGAVGWANRFVAPIRMMGAALGRVRGGESLEVPVAGVREFRSLGRVLNSMVESLAVRRDRALEAIRTRTRILRALLPSAAIDQVTIGDRQFVETVPQATVAVVTTSGLDESVSVEDVSEIRSLFTRIVDDLDQSAELNGLERVKVHGDTYVAVCGITTPHLDHAPRALAFAAAAVRAMEMAFDDQGLDATACAAISSGTVTAGLVGDSRLVFDVWGVPMEEANDLARLANPGEILITPTARVRLPDRPAIRDVRFDDGSTAYALRASDADAEVSG